MVFQNWGELEAQRPYENGIWDKTKLFEFLVQSCTRTFREQIDEYFAGYREDEKVLWKRPFAEGDSLEWLSINRGKKNE